ncbi:TetR/AcrR family transcriptional regulator C-terminal domain-containing protein, partial [Escherichia coli]|nr:TetR/AcrR family transcriptional regulator C-terminal domain-containing protein [Escherichia coli]
MESGARSEGERGSFLGGNVRRSRGGVVALRVGARLHAGKRPGAPQMETADAQLRFLCEAGFSAGDAVNALMTISYFTFGAGLEEQAGDSDAGQAGGPVEQVPSSPLCGARLDLLPNTDPAPGVGTG